MKHTKLPILGLSLALVGMGTFATLRTATGTSPQDAATTALDQVPIRLVYAQPFRVVEPYTYGWMDESDAPQVEGGWILAVASDPEISDVKQTHDELLFVGDMPVERMNVGSVSGVVIGFVPSPLDAAGQPTLDLATTPIYWAKPEILPESMTATDARDVFTAALAAGVKPQTSHALTQSRQEGGETIDVDGLGELHRYSANLIERYAPEEADLISGLRAEKLY
jgi:hypothetical protein